MGYMRHHAIIVTSWNDEAIKQAHENACTIFPYVSEISIKAINDYKSFFIPPDGSKEGWEDSNQGDALRDQFIEWLQQQAYEDGSSCLDWVEVQYGDDDHQTKIVRDSYQRHRKIGRLEDF